MPSWLSLLVEVLADAAAASPVKLFLVKAVIHVEMRAWAARLDQLNESAPGPSAAGQLGQADQPTGHSSTDPASAQEETAPALNISNTIFARFAEHLFPGMVAALVPGAAALVAGSAADELDDGAEGDAPQLAGAAAAAAAGTGGGSRTSTFHYVLRDFVFVVLMWPRLFERTGECCAWKIPRQVSGRPLPHSAAAVQPYAA
jgi:hypothetical protein